MTIPKRKWSARFHLILGFATLLLLGGGFAYWATTSNISGAIIANGRIEVDQNRQVVQHPDGGVVSELLVDEGMLVEEGQALIRLDPTLLAGQRSIIEKQLFELVARRGRLEAEQDGRDAIQFDEELISMSGLDPEIASLMEGQTRLFRARGQSLETEIEQLQRRGQQIADQIIGIEAQQASISTQLTLIERELTDQQTLLDRGLAQAARVLALEREKASLAGRVGELAASKAQAEGRATELEIAILGLRDQRREEAVTRLRDLQYREFELQEQRRSLTEQLNRLEIQAPVSGIVYGLSVFTPRSVIQGAQPVLYLVPQDRPLVIAAQVPPIHVDQIYVGQDVTLRFSALDSRNTPELIGQVVQVSADAFTDEGTRLDYYRAEIHLSEGEQGNLPAGTTLVPGMPVEAFLKTDDRTPIAYLVRPLADYFAKAFRES